MTAAALLAEARAAGVTLRLVDGKARVSGNPAPELLARLREAKPEIVGILSGSSCCYCALPIRYPDGAATPLPDGRNAHYRCHVEAEIDRLSRAGDRAVNSPDALADPAEVGLEGRPLP